MLRGDQMGRACGTYRRELHRAFSWTATRIGANPQTMEYRGAKTEFRTMD
jgi:hypothetical protein